MSKRIKQEIADRVSFDQQAISRIMMDYVTTEEASKVLSVDRRTLTARLRLSREHPDFLESLKFNIRGAKYNMVNKKSLEMCLLK